MLIPTTVSYIILFALLAIILLDYIFSVITVIRLKRRIKYLSNIEELLGDDAHRNMVHKWCLCSFTAKIGFGSAIKASFIAFALHYLY